MSWLSVPETVVEVIRPRAPEEMISLALGWLLVASYVDTVTSTGGL